MKNKRLISLVMSLLLVMTIVAPALVFAESTEGVKIVSTTPEDGSVVNTPMGAAMEVEFNSPIDSATLSTATISCEPAAIAAVVPNKASSTKCTVYFSALELDTKYKVTFSKQIKSTGGERLSKTDITFKTTAQYPQHHQIVNGDMESTEHLNMFELAGAPKNVISYQKEEENSILKFNPGWAGAGVGQYVYLEPGKTYEMRAKIKSTTSQMVRMIMSYVSLSEGASNWWHPIVSKTVSADQWVEFSGTVTIPADLSYDHDRLIRITAQNKGQVIYVDDFQFYETGFDIPMPKTKSSQGEEDVLQTYISDGNSENAEIEQLVGLGIFEADMTEKADMKISRLDAAVYMARIGGIVGMETAKLPTDFTDLEGVRKRDAAQALVDRGIMKGYGKYFYPNNSISTEDVLESMVNLLGYQPMADDSGYPATITKLKLNKGIKTKKSAITCSDFAKILVNALDVDVVEDYSVSHGEDLLWNALEVREMKGIITATEYTDIYGGSKALPGNVVIDGVSYAVAIDTYGMEGKKVRFFTKEIDNEDFILYITETETLNNVLELDWDDIEEYSDSAYVYTNEQNKRKKASLARNKKLIYNGVALNDYKTDELDVSYGNVQLIDNNNDNVYDIVRIEEFDTYVVSSVNHDEYTIYNEYSLNDQIAENNDNKLDLSDVDNIVVEENGQKVQFGNIVAGTVVSVAQSKDKSFAKLYVSKNKLESNVGKIFKEGANTSIALYDSIHGAGASSSVVLHPFYGGTKKIRDEGNAFFGQTVLVSTDHMGYAVTVIIGGGTTDWIWGYLMEARTITDDFTDETKVNFKLFDESGEFVQLVCAKKVSVNGKSVKTESLKVVLSAINGVNGGDTLVCQLIRFKKNINDEISQILSAGDAEFGMSKISGSNETYSSALKALGYRVVISSTNIPVISVPSTITKEKEREFVWSTAADYLVNEKEYTFDAYSIDDNDMDAEFVVLKDRPAKNTDSWIVGMIMDISEVMDDEGEICKNLAVRNTASNYTAKVYPDMIDIENLTGKDNGTGLKAGKGDIIMYQNNPEGVAVKMHILYSRENKTLYTKANPSPASNGNNRQTTGYRSVYGTISQRNGSLIRVLPQGAEDKADNYDIYNLSLYSRIMLFDDSKALPITGSEVDVLEGKEIVVVSSWGGLTLMAVYD